MVTTVENDPSIPVKRVYEQVLLGNEVVDDDAIPEFSHVRSKLSRKRMSLIPPIPHDVHDVEIENEWSETWTGELFLSHQDNDWGISIFATDDNLRKLQRCETVYMDGTFKSCPQPYVQFVTIHGLYHGRVLPFVMCLMDGKTVGKYRQLL